MAPTTNSQAPAHSMEGGNEMTTNVVVCPNGAFGEFPSYHFTADTSIRCHIAHGDVATR